MNPILLAKIAAVVIAVLAIFFTGKSVERSKWLQREIEINQMAVDAKAAADKKINDVSTAYEQLKSSKQTTQTNITRNLSNEIAQNRSQYDCPVPAAAKLLINQAASAANTGTGKPGGAVSKN
jgi:predicted RNA-binding protein YlxR (DUF448 family)